MFVACETTVRCGIDNCLLHYEAVSLVVAGADDIAYDMIDSSGYSKTCPLVALRLELLSRYSRFTTTIYEAIKLNICCIVLWVVSRLNKFVLLQFRDRETVSKTLFTVSSKKKKKIENLTSLSNCILYSLAH